MGSILAPANISKLAALLAIAVLAIGTTPNWAVENPIPPSQPSAPPPTAFGSTPVIPHGGGRVIIFQAIKTSQGVNWHPWDGDRKISNGASLLRNVPPWASILIVPSTPKEEKVDTVAVKWKAARNFAFKLHKKLELKNPVYNGVAKHGRNRPAHVIVKW